MSRSNQHKTLTNLLLLIIITTTTLFQSTSSLNIIITGSSQGIGLSAAKTLLSSTGDHTIYHACRNTDRASHAVTQSGGGIPMVCDLCDFSSIRNFASDMQKKKIDVLCLNAAVSPNTRSKRPKRTVDGLEECIGVNHLGHFLLANLLKDTLDDNDGRIVITASSVHDPEAPGGMINGKGGADLGDLSGLGRILKEDDDDDGGVPTMPNGSVEYDGLKIYNDSKLCNVLFAREAHKRWGEMVSIRAFNPGFIPTTGLFREPRKDNWLAAKVFVLIFTLLGKAVPVEVGGERLAFMATASDEEVPSGSYFSGDVGSRVTSRGEGFDVANVSKEALDDDKAKKLWDLSCKIVGC